MNSFNDKQISKMYFNAIDRGMPEKAERYLGILRDRMASSPKGRSNAAKGLVLEMRPVREHERDGVEVVEHIKGFWVKGEVAQ